MHRLINRRFPPESLNISRLLQFASGTLILTSISLLIGANSSWAQRSRLSFDSTLISGAECATGSSSRWGKMETTDENVSIGRQLRQPEFYLQTVGESYIVMSCSINPERYINLNLDMGVSDGEHPDSRMTVNIYQGGSIHDTYRDLTAGDELSTTLTLTGGGGAENISIELTCHETNSSGRCNLYGFTTDLLADPSYTGPAATSLNTP